MPALSKVIEELFRAEKEVSGTGEEPVRQYWYGYMEGLRQEINSLCLLSSNQDRHEHLLAESETLEEISDPLHRRYLEGYRDGRMFRA